MDLPEASLLPGARAPHPARPGTPTTTGLRGFEPESTWPGLVRVGTYGALPGLAWCGAGHVLVWPGLVRAHLVGAGVDAPLCRAAHLAWYGWGPGHQGVGPYALPPVGGWCAHTLVHT